MRSKTLSFVAVALVALAIAACSSAQAAPPSQQGDGDTPDPRTLTVNGTGVVDVTPDLARIAIGVQTEGPEAAAAVSENSAQAQAIIAALADFGIAEEDIRTSSFNVFPRQERDSEGNLTGITYVVQNTVQVTVRELDQFGEVLDAAVQAGANNISDIQFDVADRSALNAKALAAAVEDARARAEILADAAGVELVQVLSLDSFGSSPVFAAQRVSLEFAEAADIPIAPGQIQITVDVNVRYEIQ